MDQFKVGDLVTGGICLYKVLSTNSYDRMTIQVVGPYDSQLFEPSEMGKVYSNQYVYEYTLVKKKTKRNLPAWF